MASDKKMSSFAVAAVRSNEPDGASAQSCGKVVAADREMIREHPGARVPLATRTLGDERDAPAETSFSKG